MREMVDRPWTQADTNTNQIDCLGAICTIHKSIAKRMRKTYAVAPWHENEGGREGTSFIRPLVLALRERWPSRRTWL